MTREKLGLKIRDLAVRAKRGGLSLGHAVSWEVITLANVQSAYLVPGSVLSTFKSIWEEEE